MVPVEHLSPSGSCSWWKGVLQHGAFDEVALANVGLLLEMVPQVHQRSPLLEIHLELEVRWVCTNQLQSQAGEVLPP